MKHFFLGASICLGILAFTKLETGNHYRACGNGLVYANDTTPSKDTTKPKTQVVAFNRYALQDTTPKDSTTKPKSGVLLAWNDNDTTPAKDTSKKIAVSYAALYHSWLRNDTTPSKDTSKKSAIQLVYSGKTNQVDTTPSKLDTSSKPKSQTLIAWASR